MKLKSLIYFFCALLLSIILIGEKPVISFSLNPQQNPKSTNPKTIYVSQESSRQTVSSPPICTPKGCYEKPRGDQIMVISPSQGEYLLNNRPTISLLSQQNGEEYVIKFENSKGILFKFIPENDQVLDDKLNILYPRDKPSLQHQDGTISVTIETEKKRTRRNFKVVNNQKRQDIQNQVNNIKNSTSDLDKTLAVANFYLDNNLITEAINTLENAIGEEQDLFSIYLQLGQLYLQKVGVASLAQENYLQALEKTQTADDLSNQIDALIGLVKSNLKLQNLPKAIAHLQEAYNISWQLNDLGLIAQIEQFLGEIYQDLGKKEDAINWYKKARDSYETLGKEEYQKVIEEKILD